MRLSGNFCRSEFCHFFQENDARATVRASEGGAVPDHFLFAVDRSYFRQTVVPFLVKNDFSRRLRILCVQFKPQNPMHALVRLLCLLSLTIGRVDGAV